MGLCDVQDTPTLAIWVKGELILKLGPHEHHNTSPTSNHSDSWL